jgi:hypothetical protein
MQSAGCHTFLLLEALVFFRGSTSNSVEENLQRTSTSQALCSRLREISHFLNLSRKSKKILNLLALRSAQETKFFHLNSGNIDTRSKTRSLENGSPLKKCGYLAQFMLPKTLLPFFKNGCAK